MRTASDGAAQRRERPSPEDTDRAQVTRSAPPQVLYRVRRSAEFCEGAQDIADGDAVFVGVVAYPFGRIDIADAYGGWLTAFAPERLLRLVDRDTEFTSAFADVLEGGQVSGVRLIW